MLKTMIRFVFFELPMAPLQHMVDNKQSTPAAATVHRKLSFFMAPSSMNLFGSVDLNIVLNLSLKMTQPEENPRVEINRNN